MLVFVLFLDHTLGQYRICYSGSQKVQQLFSGFKYNSEIISITKMGGSEISSDLERAAAARSIAAEFFDPPILVIELQRRC